MYVCNPTPAHVLSKSLEPVTFNLSSFIQNKHNNTNG